MLGHARHDKCLNASVLLAVRMFWEEAGFGYGSGGRTRTGTELPQLDFESSVSTNFTTPP